MAYCKLDILYIDLQWLYLVSEFTRNQIDEFTFIFWELHADSHAALYNYRCNEGTQQWPPLAYPPIVRREIDPVQLRWNTWSLCRNVPRSRSSFPDRWFLSLLESKADQSPASCASCHSIYWWIGCGRWRSSSSRWTENDSKKNLKTTKLKIKDQSHQRLLEFGIESMSHTTHTLDFGYCCCSNS